LAEAAQYEGSYCRTARHATGSGHGSAWVGLEPMTEGRFDGLVYD